MKIEVVVKPLTIGIMHKTENCQICILQMGPFENETHQLLGTNRQNQEMKGC